MPRNRSLLNERWGSALARGLRWLGIGLLICVVVGAGQSLHRVEAGERLAVDLLYFRAESGDHRPFPEWETGTELDTAGFPVERAESAGGAFPTLEEIAFIGARGSVSAGAADADPTLGGRRLGAESEEETKRTAPPAQQEGGSSTLLLWLGFLAALFIFVGGVAFSIYLTMRNRRNGRS